MKQCTKIVCPDGHQCVGFCGEDFPPCYTCNKDQFFLLTGVDVEPDEKFIKLDCSHCVSSTQLDIYLESFYREKEMKLPI